MNIKKGFTVIEILIVITIIGIILSIVISSSSQISRYTLQKTSESVASILEKAHSRAQNSYNGVKHSVLIASTSATLFEGTSYSANAPTNEVINYDSGINVIHTSINGGGGTITFDKVKGTTNNYGLIKFAVTNATTSSSTIIIGETGIIQIQ